MSLKHQLLNLETGRFGPYGGRYVPELLVPIMDTLRDAFNECIKDNSFLDALSDLYHNYSGRPTPLYYCENLTKHLGGAQIYLKNEGLNHTGAHKINHCLGQGLLAKRMGKPRIIAETGAGQHGLASATICAKLGLECIVYMGRKDYDRQRPNVFWMERLGATVIPVEDGGQVLRDAINAALKDLIAHPTDTHYLLGTVCGPHPYPVMNTFFQSIVGQEVRQQLLKQKNKKPDYLIACVGGGSNAMGLFYEFLDDKEVQMIGVEAGGRGITESHGQCDHAARMQTGTTGVSEGMKSCFLQDSDGQLKNTHSISAGLDYSGVGPQHAFLRDLGRVQYTYAEDAEVMDAYKTLAKHEGILPAMESTHAMVEVLKLAPRLPTEQVIVVNCSGRGDKDLFIVANQLDSDNFKAFLKTQSK